MIIDQYCRKDRLLISYGAFMLQLCTLTFLLIVSKVVSLPTLTDSDICTAILQIVFFCKLKGAYCGHISSADPYPKLCVPGNYCATAWEQAFCPKGHFCPLGASQPRLCSSLFAG